jgi:hypothetical protein
VEVDMQERDAEHAGIVALADRALTAARDHDHRAVVATTQTLLRALAVHLDDERLERTARDAEARARWTVAVDALAEEFVAVLRCASQPQAASECGCERVASSAVRRLVTQIRAESAVSEEGR